VVSFDRKGQTEDLAVPLCWKDRAVGPLDRGRGDQRRAMGVLSSQGDSGGERRVLVT